MTNRYFKQELFLGKDRQSKIETSHVVIFGAGALGSSIAEMLVRAGVGMITIIDRDYVEFSNLHRQQLYTEEDAKYKLPKAIAAEKRLQKLNSNITIKGIIADINFRNVETMVEGVSIIMDATDNFETRLVINDAAIKHNIPFVFGACVSSYGLTYPILPNETPCFHCLIDHIPENNITCDTTGIINPIVQWTAAMQVSQGLQIMTDSLVKPMLRSFDIWKMEHGEIDVLPLKNNQCPTCGEKANFPYLSIEKQTKADILCGRDAVHIRPPTPKALDLHYLSNQWNNLVSKITVNPYLLSFQYEEYRIILFQDGRAIIHGTAESSSARKIYNRFLG